MFIAHAVMAQQSPAANTVRLVAKSSIKESFDIQRFEEGLEYYADEPKRSYRCSFLTLSNLARIASGQEAEAFDCMNSLLGKTMKRTKGNLESRLLQSIELAAQDAPETRDLMVIRLQVSASSDPWRRRVSYSA